MTKAEYIDFIRNSLPQVDKTNRFHREQVSAAINEAVNTVFYEVHKANPKAFKKSMERYSTMITSSPDGTVITPRYVSELTIDVVDLPTKSGGVLEIMNRLSGFNTVLTSTTDFVPVSTMEGEQLYGSESTLPGSIIGFSWSGDRTIEYWGDMSAIDSVFIRVIQQFKSYASTDNVIFPYGQNARILELVREYLGVTPPKDIINNNTNNG
jgi:hypothetical protein